jgi:hypothetical protein
MSETDLYDKYGPVKPSSKGIPALLNPDDREDPDRPLRTEDLIPRHGSHDTPKIWLPDGSGMQYYGRPSGWGACADNEELIAEWSTSKVVEGLLDTGEQGRTLRGERAMLGPREENKGAHKALHKKAKNLVFTADREGTLKHKMTEKYDLGIGFAQVEEYDYVIDEWVRLTRFMPNVHLASGREGVECFVAMDKQRLDQYGQPMFDEDGTPIMIRTAGTFDRLKRWTPCPICGKSNRIVDLKTSSVKSFPYAQRKSGIQLGQYGNAEEYVPWPDGKGADRYPLPDVCLHTGILVSIPPDAPGSLHYVDIARGFFRAVSLIPWIKEHQKEQDWMVEFTPTPNIWLLIDQATTTTEVQALWRQHPGEHWEGALTKYACARIDTLSKGVITWAPNMT